MTTKNAKTRRRRGPGRLNAEDAAGLEDRLLDGAGELFSEQGYGGATIEEIARRARASTKTIYSRYDGKGDILLAVVARLMARMQTEQVPKGAAEGEPREYLIGFFAELCRWLATDAVPLNRLLFAEAFRFPELRDAHLSARSHYEGIVRAALSEWRDKGLLPDLDDVAKAASLCLTMVTERVLIRAAIGDPPSTTEIEADVAYAVDVFLRGCGYQEGVASTPPKAKRRVSPPRS